MLIEKIFLVYWSNMELIFYQKVSMIDTEWSDRIEQNRSRLSRAETEVLSFVNANPERATFLSQRDLAGAAGVSKPTIISFFRKLGYPDYRTFQNSVESFFSTHLDSFRASEDMQKRVSTVDDLLEHALAVERRSLDRLTDSIPPDLLSAFVRAVEKAPSIFILGIGTGYYPAHYLAQRLRRYRFQSHFVSQDQTHIVDELFPLKPDDTVIVFHYSSSDDYLLPVLRFAHERGAHTILASDTIHPDYVRESERFVHVPRGELGFKNSMAVPMAFANLLLLAVEIVLGAPIREHLKDLEDTRRIWGQQ